MGIYDESELIDKQQLKNKTVQKYNASNSNSFITKSLSYVRMYKRTQFSMNIGVGGVQSYLASRFRPNILNTTITLKASGIVRDDETAINTGGLDPVPIQYNEFYYPAEQILNSFIYNLYSPKEMLLVSKQSGKDIGSDNIINIVQDTNKGQATKYPTMSITSSHNYKLYYPALARGSLGNKLIALHVSAQDKVYSLSKTLISG